MSNNKIKKISIRIVACSIALTLFSSIFATSYYYNAKDDSNSVESSISTVAQPEFSFQSQSQYLIEPTTGKVLYAHNEDEKLLPASVTKVMTLLLIMEQIDSGKMAYTDTVTCSTYASKMGGSQIWFKEGETLTIDEALKAICVVSANDVTVAMAEKIGGSESNFTKMMNDRAKELGMINTNFMNPHGIDEENHYTTAKDIAIMGRELVVKHPDILKYTSIWQDTLRNGTFGLSNTNKLIRFYEGATGLKTGSTSQALFNLISSATRNNTTFIAVVMKAPSSDIRLQESKQLLDYAFATYETQNIYTADTVIEEKDINKCIDDTSKVAIKDDISSLVEKGKKIEISENIVYDENIKAPLTANQKIGRIEIYNKSSGEKIAESDLIIKNDITKSNFGKYIQKLINIFILREFNNK